MELILFTTEFQEEEWGLIGSKREKLRKLHSEQGLVLNQYNQSAEIKGGEINRSSDTSRIEDKLMKIFSCRLKQIVIFPSNVNLFRSDYMFRPKTTIIRPPLPNVI
jgi:hypothetical protein